MVVKNYYMISTKNEKRNSKEDDLAKNDVEGDW
jgi:hypothetical protein